MIAVFGAVFAIGVQVTASLLLAWWGARIGRWRGGLWRHLVWGPLVGLVAGVLGVVLTAAGLVWAFTSVEGAPAQDKAQLLSDGISGAMMATAIFGSVSVVMTALSFVGCVVGTALPAAPDPVVGA